MNEQISQEEVHGENNKGKTETTQRPRFNPMYSWPTLEPARLDQEKNRFRPAGRACRPDGERPLVRIIEQPNHGGELP